MIKVRKESIEKMSHLERMVTRAQIMTLNDAALTAARLQKIQLRKDFTLRNKWTEGSIWPKVGKSNGMAPLYKTDVTKVFARTGSVQEYLAKQETGRRVKDPETPTDDARIGKSEKRVISKPGKLPILRRMPTISKRSVKKMRGKKNKWGQMFAMLNYAKKQMKGVIRVTKKDKWATPGYFKMAGDRGQRYLVMIRSLRQGNYKRYPNRWHNEALNNRLIDIRTHAAYKKNMETMLRGIK